MTWPWEIMCPHFEDHTPCPEGYLQWHAWAETMSKTHQSTKCAGCNRYTIWVPKRSRLTAGEGAEGG